KPTNVAPSDLPTGVLDRDYSLAVAMRMIATLYRLERVADGRIKVARSVAEIRDAMANNVLAPVLHFEGAEPIDAELGSLEAFYAAGLRSLGLVWSRPNTFAHGVPFKNPSTPDIGPGLTDAGRALVRACDELGILVDVSHLNWKGFWEVAEISTKPFVASHSNAHAVCSASRNLTDDQLRVLRERGGLVGLNFSITETRPDGKPDADISLDLYMQHLEHLLEHMGEDGVGIGSDFDGCIVARPIKDAAGLPNLVQAMRNRGFGDALIAKIARDNWLRVLSRAWGE
ncbi:MAG: dipeptidase, partial [Pseudomonadota bacterium]